MAIKDISPSARLFNSLVIVLGVGVSAYTFLTATRFIIEGALQNKLGKRRLDRKIMKLDGHYMICGNGRIGSLVCIGEDDALETMKKLSKG